MPLVNRPFYSLSQLVLHEKDPNVGYAREVISVTVGANTTLPLGTVVYRAKAATETAYAPLTASSQLVTTNEFAVLFGDRYGAKPEGIPITTTNATDNAVAFVRDNVILKDYLLKQIYTTGGSPVLTAPQFEALRHLLKEQGVILEITV